MAYREAIETSPETNQEKQATGRYLMESYGTGPTLLTPECLACSPVAGVEE